ASSMPTTAPRTVAHRIGGPPCPDGEPTGKPSGPADNPAGDLSASRGSGREGVDGARRCADLAAVSTHFGPDRDRASSVLAGALPGGLELRESSMPAGLGIFDDTKLRLRFLDRHPGGVSNHPGPPGHLTAHRDDVERHASPPALRRAARRSISTAKRLSVSGQGGALESTYWQSASLHWTNRSSRPLKRDRRARVIATVSETTVQ